MALFLASVSVAHAQTTTPTVDTVAVTSDPGTDDTYALGDTIEVGLTFSEAVTVTGDPYLLIDVGGTNRRADYHSGTGTTQLLFRYTVLAGDDDDDGIAVVTNSLTLNGGTIVATDDATAATLDHAALTTTAHKVDIVVTLLSNFGQTEDAYTRSIRDRRLLSEAIRTGNNPAGYQITSITLDIKSSSDTLELLIYLSDSSDGPLGGRVTYEFTGSVSNTGTQLFTLKEDQLGNLKPNETYHLFFFGRGTGSVQVGSNTSYEEDAGGAEGWDVVAPAGFEPGDEGSIRLSIGGYPSAVPYLTDVSIISTPLNGVTYHADEHIEVEMVFSYFTQMLDQSFQVPLNLGGGTERQVFARLVSSIQKGFVGDEQTRFLFVYTVDASDIDNDGIVIDRAGLLGDNGGFAFTNSLADDVPVSASLRFAKIGTDTPHPIDGSMNHDCVHIFCTTGDFYESGIGRVGHFVDVQGIRNTYFRYGAEEYVILSLYHAPLNGQRFVFMGWDRSLPPSQRVIDRLTLDFAGTQLHLRDAQVNRESSHVGFTWLNLQLPGVTEDRPTIHLKENVDVSFGSDTYTVDEDGTVEVEVTLSADVGRDVKVPITVVNQNGATDQDYNTVPTEVTITAGEMSKSFVITPVDDSVDDDDESLKVLFGTLPENLNPGTTTETVVTIVDNDDPQVEVNFRRAIHDVAEGASQTVTVNLTADPERTVVVPLTATDRDGATSADYAAISASVTFEPGDTSKTFTFTATDDAIDDDGERVVLGFGTLPDGVTPGTVPTSTVSIIDDDAPASVAVSWAQTTYSVAEGGSVTVTAELDDDPEKTVVVPIARTDQGGADSGDYTGAPATITFESGDTSKSFTFTATDDALDDDGESVQLAFGPTLPSGVTQGTPAGTVVRITDDDDPQVNVSYGLAEYTAAEGGSVTVTVELDADPERTVVIPVTHTARAGATGADYFGVPADVTFEAGDTEKTFTFSATDDTVDDDDEEVLLGFGVGLPAGVTAATPATSIVTITDDDDPEVKVSFARSSYTAPEGATVSVVVELDADPERSVTIPITATNEGGATSADYSVPDSVTFAAGETAKAVVFTATMDAVDDDDESVELAFGTALPARVTTESPATTKVSITDDDVPQVKVSFAQAEYTGAEGATVTVTVELDADPERTVVVPITHTPQDGADGADYSGAPANVTFISGDTSENFTITLADDTVDDDDESVTFGFGAGLPVGVVSETPATATVRITDDDDPEVKVSYSRATYTVAEGGTVTITVELDADPERTVVIPLTHAPGTGADSAEYSRVPESVTFDSGDTSKTFTLSATQDAVDDDGETVLLGFGSSLPDRVTTETPATATVTIVDDDDPEVAVSFAQASHSVAEGSAVTVNVTLSADPERTVVITISAANQGGASGGDYSAPNSVTFESGDTSKGITFSATQDDIDDDGESVVLAFATLPDRVSESAANPSATVTILDDDNRGVMVTPTSLPVDEGMTAEYTVVLKSEPTGSVTVTVKDPTDNTDVTAGPASLAFDENDWDTPQTVTVSAAQDADGVNESATVTHTLSGADYASETASDVIVTVVDDETPGVTIDPTGFTVVPGGSNEYTVVLDTEPTVPVTVTITGHEGTDLTVGPELLTFDENDWDTPKTVEVSAGETAETDTVTLSHNLSGGEYGPLAADDVAVSIVKGSGALNVQVGVTGSPQSLTVPEDQSRTYSVFLSAVPTGNVTVAISLPTGNDLSINTNALTFTVDDWNVPQDVRVTAADDDDGIPDAKITIGNAVSGGGYGSGDSFDVEVTIEENDTPAVTLSTVSLVIADGKTDTYTVALDTQPSDDVTVVINDPTDNTDVTASPASLTFTPTDWKSGKTVTVTSVLDHDTDTETATITHTVSGGDYAAVTAKDVLVTVTDGCHVFWCGVLVMEKDPRFTRELRTVSLDDDDFDYGGQYYRLDRPKMYGGYGGEDPQETFDLTVRMPERAWFELNVLGPLFHTEHYLDWTLYVNGVELPFSEAKTYWADLDNWRILFKWYGREFHELFPPGEQGAGTTIYLSIAETPLADRTPKVTGPPLYLRVETRNRDELRAGWTRPQMRNDDDHNLYVDSYKIQWKKSTGSWETPADVTEAVYTPSGPRFFESYIIEGLPPGVEYDVRVIATNSVGDSEPSNVASGMVEPDSSGQQANSPARGGPGIRGVARAGETLTATTSGIRDDDGLDNAVFAFQWVRSELGAESGTAIAGATGSSYGVTAEDEGRAITVRVTFTDDAGNEESVISYAVVAAAALPQTRAPDAPGAPDVSAHDSTSLAVSWTAPASDGGSTITGYKVQWKEAADSWDTPADVSEAAATGTSHTITGLTAGTAYSVRVLAINDIGEGLPSDDGSGTPRETVPPELSGASVDGATLTLTFNEALDEDSKPATTAFTVTVGGNVRAVDYVDVIGGAVNLTLASAVTSQDTVTVSYTVPASESAERLRDAVGNAAASFTGRSVTNDTGPAAPLTASVHDAPESHNGTDAFTFELRFSETPRRGFGYETLRDHAFTVTGGDVVRAKRLERGKNVRWEITVRPDSNGAVTIVLPVTTDCNAQGAVCTGDGRMLSNRLELTVSGPDG